MLTSYPPGLDSPMLYMGTVAALLLGLLLALEWLWRLVWDLFERPFPFKSPATAVRCVLILLLVAAVVKVGPRLWLFMRWPFLSTDAREWLLRLSGQAEIIGAVLFSLAWLLAYVGQPMISYQLEKRPLPMHLWPTPGQLIRPLKIGVGVLAISFALTYLR
jgi:hypothetical protein